jgi:4-cresol dehydrogenase (hydroxylating)
MEAASGWARSLHIRPDANAAFAEAEVSRSMLSDPKSSASVVSGIEERRAQFLDNVRQVIGAKHVVASPADVASRSRDPVPGGILPIAFVYPGSTPEIQAVLRLAERCGISIWPQSSGRNWGWSNSPSHAGSVIMGLERMNRILQVDEDLAYAVVEPGVTYEDLNNHLKERRIKLWADCTGGPPKGSVLGNALDRGVGVTTYGDHFASLCGLEVVLADGSIVRTGGYPADKQTTRYTYKWGVGSYVEGLFSQANLGIVTQAGIWLMPQPDAHLMFGFTMQDERQIVALLNALRRLALHGVIPDKIRVTNDFAVLTILTQWFKENLRSADALSEADMRQMERKYRFGAWSFCSSVYGHKEQVKAARKIIERELSPYGRVLFFDDHKVAFIQKLLPGLLKLHGSKRGLVDWFSGRLLNLSMPMIQALPALYGIYRGIPTEQIVRRAYFRSRVERPAKNVHVAQDGVGLIWFGPLVPLEGQVVFDLVDLYRSEFRDHGFDCYITILMLNARTAVPLMGILYRTDDPAECERAVTLYRKLCDDSLRRGYQQFRCGRLGWDSIYRHNPALLALNTKIKAVFDPRHTIAPGKYGIQ